MDRIEVEFGITVRRLRERKGFSQEEFAGMADVHRTYMSSIERGKVQVSIAVAQKVAEALDIPLSRLWREIEKSRSNEQ